MNRTTKRSVVALGILAVLLTALVPRVSAYCLTGVRWPDDNQPAPVRYNASGKITSGQCISSSQMDEGDLRHHPWRLTGYAGTNPRQGEPARWHEYGRWGTRRTDPGHHELPDYDRTGPCRAGQPVREPLPRRT
jgi:hypothetical protein